jgi:lysophosphatidate acyltransferase
MSFLAFLIKPLVYLSLPIICAAWFTPTGRYYLRVGIFIASLSAVGTANGFIALVMAIAGRKYDVNSVVGSSFYYIASRTLGITIEVEGEEYLETKPAVMIGNHQSMLDIIWLGRMFPKQASIMAKKSIQWNPVLGPFMMLSGTVFVDRGNSAKAQRSLQAAGEGMKARRTSLFIFAEGTRHSEEAPTLLPFKKGAFHLAVKGGIPIIPVVCENYWRLYHKGIFGSGPIKIKILPPVPTAGLTADEVSALTIRVRDQMLTTLRGISVQVPSSKSEQSPDPAERDSGLADQGTPTPNSIAPGDDASGVNLPSETVTPSKFETASTTVSQLPKKEGSENGTETEEDEGMVLVGRPR